MRGIIERDKFRLVTLQTCRHAAHNRVPIAVGNCLNVILMREKGRQVHAGQRAAQVAQAAVDSAGHIVVWRPFIIGIAADFSQHIEELAVEFRVPRDGQIIGIIGWVIIR